PRRQAVQARGLQARADAEPAAHDLRADGRDALPAPAAVLALDQDVDGLRGLDAAAERGGGTGPDVLRAGGGRDDRDDLDDRRRRDRALDLGAHAARADRAVAGAPAAVPAGRGPDDRDPGAALADLLQSDALVGCGRAVGVGGDTPEDRVLVVGDRGRGGHARELRRGDRDGAGVRARLRADLWELVVERGARAVGLAAVAVAADA